MEKITAYYAHLHQSIEWEKENSLRQVGRSDIEPPNPIAVIEAWTGELFAQIEQKPPEYYVERLRVLRRGREVLGIAYDYWEGDDPPINRAYISFEDAEKSTTAQDAL